MFSLFLRILAIDNGWNIYAIFPLILCKQPYNEIVGSYNYALKKRSAFGFVYTSVIAILQAISRTTVSPLNGSSS